MDPGPGGLMERIALGPVITDGAYFLELERRCLGSYASGVPDAVLRNPEGVLELHREYASAGSEVILAMGWGVQSTDVPEEKEHNRTAVKLAREAAGPERLVAGNISGSGVTRPGLETKWQPLSEKERAQAQHFFARRVDQQMEVGVDAFFLESYHSVETASLAIPFIRDAGVSAVIMLVYEDSEYTVEGYSAAEAAKFLEDRGADVVGINCMRSWNTMNHIIRDIRKAVSIPVISQPAGYQMEPGEVYCHSIHFPHTYPKFEPRHASRFDMAEYASEAQAVGVNIIGGCCGTLPYHIRAIAETLGRTVAVPDLDRGYAAPTRTPVDL